LYNWYNLAGVNPDERLCLTKTHDAIKGVPQQLQQFDIQYSAEMWDAASSFLICKLIMTSQTS
jgi:hypothetical protein